MSHFSHIKTHLLHKTYLLHALRQLGHIPEEGRLRVRGFAGRRTSVDIRVTPRNSDYDIGFRKEGNHYVCVADWFGLHGLNQDTFLKKLTQQYAAFAVQDQLAAQGFSVAEERTEQGRIHLLLRRSD